MITKGLAFTILLLAAINCNAQNYSFSYNGGSQYFSYSDTITSRTSSDWITFAPFVTNSKSTSVSIPYYTSTSSFPRNGYISITTKSGSDQTVYSYSVVQYPSTTPTNPTASCSNFAIFGPSPVMSNNGHIYIATGGGFPTTPTYTWSVSGGTVAGGQGTSRGYINFANWVNGGTVSVTATLPGTTVSCSASLWIIAH